MDKIKQQLQAWVDGIIPWMLHNGVRILFLIVAATIIYMVLRKVVAKVVRAVVKGNKTDQYDTSEIQRENTLIQIFTLSLKILVALITALMIAMEFGIKIAPLLASAGVVGLALGFGGQYLIKDLISGLFIILENQYRINDFVEIAGKEGRVERTSLRMTTLRDLDGNIHHIPHGEVSTVTNLSKQFSRINLDVGVAYGTDVNQLIKIVNKVGTDLLEDKQWNIDLIEAPYFLRVEDLGDSAVVIKVVGAVRPSKQWAVTGELRKRLYEAFNELGIEIPFPQRVLYIRQESDEKDDSIKNEIGFKKKD